MDLLSKISEGMGKMMHCQNNEHDDLKFNITRRVKLATISWGWTYSEGNREKGGIRVHEECQAGTQWSWKAKSGWTERRRGMTRKQDKSED